MTRDQEYDRLYEDWEKLARGTVRLRSEIADLKRQLAERDATTNMGMDRDLCRLSIVSTWPTKDGLITREYPDRIIDRIMQIVDAYVPQKVNEARQEGWEHCLDLVRATVKGYPDNGGDIEVMTAIEHIVNEAVLAESEWWADGMHDRIDRDEESGCPYCVRLAANRAKVKP